MMTLTVPCPWCGQGQLVEVPEDATGQEMEEAATMRCDCEDAEKAREALSIMKRVKALFGEECKPVFDDSFSEEIQNGLIEFSEKVLERQFKAAVITMENGDKATIARVGGRVKISREQKVKQER